MSTSRRDDAPPSSSPPSAPSSSIPINAAHSQSATPTQSHLSTPTDHDGRAVNTPAGQQPSPDAYSLSSTPRQTHSAGNSAAASANQSFATAVNRGAIQSEATTPTPATHSGRQSFSNTPPVHTKRTAGTAAMVASPAPSASNNNNPRDSTLGPSSYVDAAASPRPASAAAAGGQRSSWQRRTSSTNTSNVRDASVSSSGNRAYLGADDAQSASGLSAASDVDADDYDYYPQQSQNPQRHQQQQTQPSAQYPTTGPHRQSFARQVSRSSQSGQTPRQSSAIIPRPQSKIRRSSSIKAGGRGASSSATADYLDDGDDDDDGHSYGPWDGEDDEVIPHDRGEELVRRRMRARQKEKRRKEKDQKMRDQATQQGTAAGIPGETTPLLPHSPNPRHVAPSYQQQQPSRPVSPTPGHERAGRPKYLSINRNSHMGDGGMLSPNAVVAPSFRQALQEGNLTGPYPSPHSHIRRTSGNSASQQVHSPSSAWRSSTAGQKQPEAQSGSQGQERTGDVFSETGRESVAASSALGDDESSIGSMDYDEEDRDTVAALRRGRDRSSDALSPEHARHENDEAEAEYEDGEGAIEEEDEQQAEEDEEGEELGNADSSSDDPLDPEDVEYTLKDRQDAINIEHPFGLPIWKPALYKKSRTVTRNAESALQAIPSRAAERHLLPGNLIWTIIFGFWLSIICIVASILLRLVPRGGSRYARVAWELGGYLFWPFGKYAEIEISPTSKERLNENCKGDHLFIDQDGGFCFLDRDGDAPKTDNCEQESYEITAFTPVAARFPHDHQHRVAFNAQSPNRARSRAGWALETHDTIRPGDHPDQPASADQKTGNGNAEAGGSSSGSSSEGRTPTRVVSEETARPNGQKSNETSPLKGKGKGSDASYGATENGADSESGDSDLNDKARIEKESMLYEYVVDAEGRPVGQSHRILGKLMYGLVFWLIIAPVLGLICLACWGLVFTIPMAKLTWVLLKNLATQPLALHFGSAPAPPDQPKAAPQASQGPDDSLDKAKKLFLPLRPGQLASRAKSYNGAQGKGLRKSKVLLCTYRAVGLQYYKYTVGGVNILFVDTLPFVLLTIIDFFLLRPYLAKHDITTGFLAMISGQWFIFVSALGSVIPLSYFIGMAVASISAQSSIGMGAVINATFGSIIEIILYGIALSQEKARLVEGSIIGSILAGVLLMPGLSMCSGATRRKEQRFNARSAGVTSTMLIMAIIGILTPTLFYQIYGTFQLSCTGCPTDALPGDTWSCKRCFYEHVPPATDPFYQENVKGLMYTCTVILVLSYGIGLWFSLRTHASQIWQNPQPVPVQAAAYQQGHLQHSHQQPLQLVAVPAATGGHGQTQSSAVNQDALTNTVTIPSAQRASVYKRILPNHVVQQLLPTSAQRPQSQSSNFSGSGGNRYSRMDVSEATDGQGSMPPLRLPESLSVEDYAKVLGGSPAHQQPQQRPSSMVGLRRQGGGSTRPQGDYAPSQPRGSSLVELQPSGAMPGVDVAAAAAAAGHAAGGHDAPSWSRAVSLTVLLSCTVLYAIIAEILVDVVDVVLDGSGIDEKFLGITLFALVPNTTEFMNAMSFAINGNIALSMEIGSAYALQVCLIQIPAMVAWSAYYNAQHPAPGNGSLIHQSFTLIFPRWDVIAIIFAVFLLTYTYIEARSNYYRGSICILSYLVLVAGFFFAPPSGDIEAPGDGAPETLTSMSTLGLDFAGRVVRTATATVPWKVWSQAVVGALWTR